MKHWTKEEDILLVSLLGKTSFEEMAKWFENRSATSLRNHAAKKLKLGNSYAYRKHTKNEPFWENPNPLNCYWAGFLAADGYICEKQGHEAVKVALSIKDEKHLKKFKEDCGYTGIISKRQSRFSNQEHRPYTTLVSLQINACKKWVADMKSNFNLCQCKSKILQGPNLSDDYLKLCFLIGYIDGDGCVSWDKYKKQPTIRFVSSSHTIIEWVKDIVDKNFNVSIIKTPKSFNIKRKLTMSTLAVSGLRAAKLFDALSAIDVPKLDRKWKNPEFLAELALYKQRFPSFFINSEKSQLIPDNLLEKV